MLGPPLFPYRTLVKYLIPSSKTIVITTKQNTIKIFLKKQKNPLLFSFLFLSQFGTFKWKVATWWVRSSSLLDWGKWKKSPNWFSGPIEPVVHHFIFFPLCQPHGSSGWPIERDDGRARVSSFSRCACRLLYTNRQVGRPVCSQPLAGSVARWSKGG